MRSSILTAALLASLTLAGAARGHEIDRTPAPDLETLRERVAEVLDQHGVPGAGLALFNRQGEIWAGGVGQADLQQALPVTADTRFRVGSVTKPFVAAALLKLVEQGRLEPDARVKDLAPEVDIQNPWHNADPVRVAQLLEHSAGFDDMHFKDAYNLKDDPNLPLLGAVNHGFEALRVRWRPGTRMSYSNPGYGVAGYVLEKLSGRPYESFIEQQLFAPLGMADSTLRFNGGRLEGLAAGYAEAGGAPVTHRPIYLRPAGNLVTTPRDLARFGRMLLSGGVLDGRRVLSAESVARMQRPETTLAARAGLAYGYGAGLHAEIMDGILLYGHSGGIDGFLSYFGYSPAHDFGFVVLLNASHSGAAMREIARLLLAYLAAEAVPAYPAVANVDEAQLAEYAGFYRRANPRNEIMHFLVWLLEVTEVRAADGKLVLLPRFGEPRRLVPVSARLFRPENAPLATTVFLDNGSERPVMIDDGRFMEPAGWFGTHVPLYLMYAAGLLMLSALLFAPVWLIRLLMGRMKGVRYWSVRLLPLGAVLALLGTLLSLVGVELVELGSVNVHTLGFAVGGVLFALLSLAAVAQSVRGFMLPVHPGVRWHSLAVSLACLWVAGYLVAWGLIGLRLWAW